MKITLDTNILPADDLLSTCKNRGWDFTVVSVTSREMEGTDFQISLVALGKITETGVYGESRYGEATYGSEETQANLEDILAIISNGAFPSDGQELSQGELRQLRDAIIFQAHVRECRDIFVTDDCRSFIRAGRRERLQERFNTRVMTREEFLVLCDGLK